MMLWYLGCRTSPRGLCRGPPAAGVHIPAEQGLSGSLPQPAGVLGTGCHVLLCEKWGRAPLAEKLLGQGCSGSCSRKCSQLAVGCCGLFQ